MLGLRIALSVAKGVIDEIGGLLSKLARRSTYSENLADSRAIVSDIDSYDLLDKATILLTPTATSDARVHCVKPSLPDYGKNLIPNSDDADSWTIVTNSGTIVNENGYLKLTDTSGSYGYAYIPITVETGKDYIITYNLVDSGTTSSNYARIGNGVNQSTYHSENNFNNTGKRTVRISPTATTIYITLISGIGVSKYAYWTDVTVQATADFDFDRASSATRINSSGLVQDMQSITDPELVLNGDFEELGDEEITNGDFSTSGTIDTSSYTLGWYSNTDGVEIANGKLTLANDASGAANAYATNGVSSTSILTTNKIYKLTFDITDNTNCLSFQIYQNAGSFVSVTNTVGSYTYYITNTSNSLFLFRNNTVNSSISLDNVSVQQVDPNDRWSLTQATITDGSLNLSTSDGSYTAATQTLGTIGNVYEISLDVSDIVGTISVAIGGGTDVNITTNGTHTVYITSASTTFEIKRKFGITNVSATIDNISVKDITFSTDVDLARINYDSNGDNGHILLEPTSTNLVTYSEDFSQWNKSAGVVVTDNTTDLLSPSGEYNASKIEYGDSSKNLFQAPTMSGNYSGSFYVKGTEGETIRMSVGGNEQNFTLSGDWDRIKIENVTALANTINVNTYGGATARTIYLWGAQLEALSYATSYIPSLTGSTVTRATETLTGSGNSTLINSTEGVLYAEIADITNDNLSDNNIISISKSTDEEFRVHIALKTDGAIQGFIREGAGNTKLDVSTTTVLPSTSFFKVAVLFESGNNKLYVNGLQIGSTDASTFSNLQLNSLQFNRGDDDKIFYGKCKALAVFNEALEDDELELLTGVTNYGSFGELASANGYTII
jgi:hypothetical protein